MNPIKDSLIRFGWLNSCIILIMAVVCFSTAFLSFGNLVEAPLLSKSYAFIAGALVCSVFLALAMRNLSFSFDWATLFVLVFTGYLLLRMLLSDSVHLNLLLPVSFLLFYFVFKVIDAKVSEHINFVIVISCLSLAIYGLMQYAEVFYVPGAFKLIGNFDNQAGMAACLSTGLPFCLALMERPGALKWLGIVSIVIIISAIILSGSRAGIISVATIGMIFLASRYKQFLNKHKFIIFIGILLFGLCCIGLFFLKEDSALGRVLIWKTSWNMIADKPILGHGPGAFHAEYMSYQAEYFISHLESEFAPLADNVTHPFNEYLSLTTEYGFVGLLVLLGLAVVITLNFSGASPYVLSVISIAVFSCFSYPTRYAFVILLLAYALSGINTGKIFVMKIHPVTRIAVIAVVSIIVFRFINDIRFESGWGNLVRQSALGKTRELISAYAELHQKWNYNPLFLYNYGAILNHAEHYSASLDIMNECSSYFNDYDVQMIIGDNHFKLHNYDEALASYSQASFMCPNRFMSLYRQVLIHDLIGDSIKADSLAYVIIHKPVKVHSMAVDRIVKEMNDRFTDGSN